MKYEDWPEVCSVQSEANGVAEVYLVWISNEKYFGFYDNSLFWRLCTVCAISDEANIKELEALNFHSEVKTVCYGSPPVWALWVLVFFLFIRVGILPNQNTSSGTDVWASIFFR